MLKSLLLIAGFWLLFFRFAYWVVLSFENKQPNRSVFIAYILEGLFLLGIFREFFTGKAPLDFQVSETTFFVGFLLIAGGVGICFVSLKQLGTSWTHAADIQARKLVTSGIYAAMRHPIYTGLIFSFVGSQVMVGSWLWVSCLFLFIPAYFQARKEEKLLLEKFGKKYSEYQKRTKMFVPGVI